MIDVSSFCVVQLLTPTTWMSHCWKSGHSLRLCLLFPLMIRACFALGALKLLLPVGIHNILVLRVVKLYRCFSALVHLSPLCSKYMCSQWLTCTYFHNCIWHLNYFSVVCKQNTLNQVPGYWIIKKMDFDYFVIRLQKYLSGSKSWSLSSKSELWNRKRKWMHALLFLILNCFMLSKW